MLSKPLFVFSLLILHQYNSILAGPEQLIRLNAASRTEQAKKWSKRVPEINLILNKDL